MGSTIVREAPTEVFEITGAIAAAGETAVGKSLREAAIADLDLQVQAPSELRQQLAASDVCVSFTSASAELSNLPAVVEAGRPLVLGTTGFTPSQAESVRSSVLGRIPAVFTSNFSIGANLLFAMASVLRGLPSNFDISLLEIHHSGKADAPSGTAQTLAEIVSQARGYSKTVHGRVGASKRARDELEISSIRGGGMPGDHEILAFGPHEMLRFEHLSFSRSAFAQGALLAASWLATGGRDPRAYTMLDVLDLGIPR
jgi:4-hydroxy-tetrahydrodipicolinate reductase